MSKKTDSLQRQLTEALATAADLRKSLVEVQGRRDEYYAYALARRKENDALQAQLVTTRQDLSEARHAVETINERLRTATACRCQMIEETAGNWRLFQTIDCPVHSQIVEVPWP